MEVCGGSDRLRTCDRGPIQFIFEKFTSSMDFSTLKRSRETTGRYSSFVVMLEAACLKRSGADLVLTRMLEVRLRTGHPSGIKTTSHHLATASRPSHIVLHS